MKKVIVNNEEIRLTANGQSIVEGSFARVTEIRGRSNFSKNNLIFDDAKDQQGLGFYYSIENNKITITFSQDITLNTTKIFPLKTLDLQNGQYILFGAKNKNVCFSIKDLYGNNITTKKDDGTSLLFTVNQNNVNISIAYQGDFKKGDTFELVPKLLNISQDFVHSSIKGITSHNRNLLSKANSNRISKWTNDAIGSANLVKLANKDYVTNFSLSSTLISNKVFWQIKNNPKLTLKYKYIDRNYYNSQSKSYDFVYNGIKQKRSASFALSRKQQIEGITCCFNDFGNIPIGMKDGVDGLCVSVQNQLEIGSTPTRYVESEIYEYTLPNEITLRSYIGDNTDFYDKDNSPISDIYFPEQGIIYRIINEDGTVKGNINSDGNFIVEPTQEKVFPIKFCYKAFNNGFEKLNANIIDNKTCYDYGAIPELVIEYEVEEKQGADKTRFDFITLDGEAICGIGYEKLKSTNQLQYVNEPSRQNDGSMQNIEDYETFVLPALEVGFNCINEETYRRLKHKLISKRTFDVGYYDKDLDKVVTMEMYVKPIDLDNFLSYGDEIIGMNPTLSFVPTLNEQTKFKVEFLNDDMSTNKVFENENGVMYGRSIETPELPSGYNYWLMIDSGFEENTYVKIKAKKQLAIFGNTKLIAIK